MAFVTAGLHLACLAALWVAYFVERPGHTEWWEVTIFVVSATVILALAAGVMVRGAVHMRRGQSRGWALASGIVALLPLTPAVLLGLPTGLYALALVNRPEVRDWFATPPAKPWLAKATAD